jgi:hypothetical protein
LKKLIIGFTIALAFASCKNDDNTTTPQPTQSRTQLISAKNWFATGYTKNGVDLWPKTSNCQKDDIIAFKADGTFIYDNGPTKCDPNDPQSYTTTWKFIDNDTKIVSDGDTTEVIELTATKMVEKAEHLGSVYISTYTAK